MSEQVTFERRSEAAEAGATIAVATTSTSIFDADAPDAGYKWIIQNPSDEDVTIRLAADGAEPGAGIVLNPGGVWEEDRYAGPVCACHHGVGGTVDILLTIV